MGRKGKYQTKVIARSKQYEVELRQDFSAKSLSSISTRTKNIIERLNKEVKRCAKPMEIVAGEKACYTLLAFISLKMEMHWRSNPVGKVRYNLPSLRNLIKGDFTQSSLQYPCYQKAANPAGQLKECQTYKLSLSHD